MADARELLKSSPLFSDLSDGHIDSLARAAKIRSFPQGSKIVEEGQTHGSGFWLIMSGTVDVLKGGQKVASLGPGEHFGEVAALSDLDTPRSADVVAATDVEALQLTRWEVKGLVKTDPDFAIAMMRSLLQRLAAAGSPEVSDIQ